LKIIAAILKRGVFGGYLFNSHAQTTALISPTLIFQSLFESVLKLALPGKSLKHRDLLS